MTDEKKKEQAEATPEVKVKGKAKVPATETTAGKKEKAKAEVKTEKPKAKAEGKGKGKAKAKGKGEAKDKGEAPATKPVGKKGKGEGKGAPKDKKGKKAPATEASAGKKVELPKGRSPYEIRYAEKCVPALMEEFKYANVMQVPRLTKIVVNTSMADALIDVKVLETAAKEIADITGQRPVLTKARKSIANFKLREGNTIGARVTLRGKVMWEFLSRLVNIALPRVRDFKGVSPKSFDGRGNFTLGLTEQIIFPEINFDKVSKVYGMNITFVTTATTNEEGRVLLKNMGMPFRT